MKDTQVDQTVTWITEAGLSGLAESAILTGACERLLAYGVPLARANVVIDTLHPVYQGRAFTWKREKMETQLSEFGRSDEGEDRWERSPFYRLEISGEQLFRRRLTAATEHEFPIFADLKTEAITDYIAMANRFAAEGVVGEMDCVYSSWATDAPRGFDDPTVADLERLMPSFALAMKSASLSRIAGTLVETYLGRDAGRKVLAGSIRRGVADRIEAVLWFSDLRNYTRISDSAEPEQIIPLLNEYADAILSAIHDCGGDVLKLMGDGTLAIFTADDRAGACHAALAAADSARTAVALVNQTARTREFANHRYVFGASYRRSLLRQHRQPRAPRLHRRRPGGQRSEPHRRPMPFRRSTACWCRPLLPPPSASRKNSWFPSAATPCAASASPKTSTPSTASAKRHCPSKMTTCSDGAAGPPPSLLASLAERQRIFARETDHWGCFSACCSKVKSVSWLGVAPLIPASASIDPTNEFIVASSTMPLRV